MVKLSKVLALVLVLEAGTPSFTARPGQEVLL